ncbi:two-component system LytT family response regulator [Arcicella aurantiaca]|uniref:Two-component system LytT family response regulator n=1 Tax=Arcicella aurantiaca TaxID=591202 RepID=A0A316EBT7_9BACT|nr:LytTR family DNA-binding domain-containing protein [Arcicella aurantiaca]PWK27154.1 two-component system LytT family response regulator [Arcicella aurantiaca]
MTFDANRGLLTINEKKRKSILVNNIVYLQSNINYTAIYLRDGKMIYVPFSLSKIDRLISSVGFVRIHQSYLVNDDAIAAICPTEIHLVNNTVLPVSRRHKKNLL